jgi:hypothetical protein
MSGRARLVWLVLAGAVALVVLGSTALAESVYVGGDWGAAGFNLQWQGSDGVEVVFSVPYLDLSELEVDGEKMQIVNLPGVFLPNNAGAPNLPGTGRFIAFPQGAKPELEVVEYRTEVFHGLNIAPAYAIPREDDDSPLVYKKDPDIYTMDGYYPAAPVLLSKPSQMRGVDVVVLGITPFQYNPVTRDLIVYKDIRVRVDFRGGSGHFGEDALRNRWWEPILQQNLLNYASLSPVDFDAQYNAGDQTHVDYVIIVPDDAAFVAWADTLKRWRNEQGIVTRVTRLSEIGGNNSTLIENYINNAYTNWNTAAVLLLSDYESSGDAYGITAPRWNNYCVSDNIYADVNGDDLPDLVLARITAQNATHLRTMIGKMLAYERQPPTDPAFYSRPLIAGGWQSDRWFILCCEVVWGYLHNELGKNPEREYAGRTGAPTSWSSNPNTYMIIDYFGPGGLGYIPESPSYLTDWSGSATGINNAINAGAFLVLHRDHGEETGWSTPSYHNSDLAGLTNDAYPFVFSINCLTGIYNWTSECFAEAFHRYDHRALGLTAASEVSYSFVNDTYLWGMFDLMWPDFDPGYPAGRDHLIGAMDLRPAFANASGKHYLQASSWPYNPSNKDETYHLFHHHGDAFITMYSEVPQNLTVLHANALLGGATSFTVTANQGSLIALSVDGQPIGVAVGTGYPVSITIPPQTPGGVMKVTVTKANYNRYMADVPVVPPSGPYVTYNGCEIDDSALGNNNGQWDFGETVDLTVEVKNIGVASASNVNVAIATSDPLVTVIDGQEFYGTIGAGDSVAIPNGFRVSVAGTVPDLHNVSFTLTATSGTSTWESYFTLTANAPEVDFDTLVIHDFQGNNNGALDPGETADFLVTLINDGHAPVENVVATVTSSNPLVTVSGNPASYGSLAPGASATRTFVVTASPAVPPGTTVTFTIDITGNGGYSTTATFDIVVGDERNVPTGPDAYGYSAWDNKDGGQSQPYDWIEIAPAAGGSGTVLALTGDDETVQATLPFSFRYYGQSYAQISVCSNGWIAMGSVTSTDYTNSAIPDPDGPEAMIAAFWDDLHCGHGGTQVCTWVDAANHRFVVEWYNIDHVTSGPRETFEIVLYDPQFWPTSTGDGIILCQYKMITDPSSATFGIENQTETVGIQYGYNGSYDLHAWPIEAGRTVTYTTNVSGPNPDVNIDLTPYGTPIRIPAAGGDFSFNLALANNESSPVNTTVWCMVTLPDSRTYGPVLGPMTRRLPGGFSRNWDLTQSVPAFAPAGVYTYHAYAGVYPNVVWSEDSFTFEKLTTGRNGPVVGKWGSSGKVLAE